MNIRKIILEEVNDFEWANDIKPNPFLNGDNVVIWLDRPITVDESQTLLNFVRESGIEPKNFYSTINTLIRYSKTNNGYIRTTDGRVGYGSSKNTFNSMVGGEQYVEYSVSDLLGPLMNESFEWAEDVPEAIDPNKEYTWDEMADILMDKFNRTRFEANIHDDGYFRIEDEEGVYKYWYMNEKDTITLNEILDKVKKTCEEYTGSIEIRDEYRELYNTLIGYEYYTMLGPLGENFDWAEDIPDSLTVGEIKQRFDGFRYYFSVGDIIEVKGSIPHESLWGDSWVINLSDSQYEVTDVMRSRMSIKPLNPDTLEVFNNTWGLDEKVYIGVEESDNDLYVHKVTY